MNKYIVYVSRKCKCCDQPLLQKYCMYCDIHMFISDQYMKEFIKEFLQELNA